MSTVLAIESSCDETAVAVIKRNEGKVSLLTSLVSSQIEIHRQFGGVVPEVACRNHSQRIAPLIEQALEEVQIELDEIDAFVGTQGPGLASSLLVGFSYAKALAVANGKPFYGINHMEGHLLSPFLSQGFIPPHLALIVSGGHTMLIDVQGYQKYTLLGRTLDDAAGEAFDKVGRMLSLPYPGGPEIEKRAHQGNPSSFKFPRALLKDSSLNFSFSGLKTSVLYEVQRNQNWRGQLDDLCASFQMAVIDCLVGKTVKALSETNHQRISLSGGVACNKALQSALLEQSRRLGCVLEVAPPALTTDNAGMIAFAGLLAFENRSGDPLCKGIDPNWALGE